MPTPPQNSNAQQPGQHVVASPNPTTDDSKTTTLVEPGKVSGTKVEPAAAKTAAPMKKTTKPKRKRRTTHDD